ncbi:uncharacterized protein BX664DRAFT_332606 [Halteromyces radiatus]|uniref:uncharacterized protein n=1 Tax=Halteromyces radiatus TaxID=101107 RepID=UPI00221EF2F1|nr:uncharacterized protein BX664DRAFT_332606 [Halteromyces radiatus]KAI8089275.1 hypothetical protein BX664DRAFT_332606 [Halteromyces radiatus]
MGGVTIAPQLAKNDNDSFLAAFNANTTQLENTNSTMDDLLSSTHGWPMEDLTGEVHDLMLRESMTWLPWMDNNDTFHTTSTAATTTTNSKNQSSLEGFDSQLLAQTLQLDGLFGQELNFDQFDETTSSLFYDEMTYDPSPVTTPLPTPSEDHSQEDSEEIMSGNTAIVDTASTITTPKPTATNLPSLELEHIIDSNDEKDDSDEEQELQQVDDDDDDSSTDDDDDDDDSDEEDGPVSLLTTTYMYLPKRQVEETLLGKITEHLQPDKLPGILSIVSSGADDQNEGEVEIDLSCLVREQLVRVMLYVDACIAEQQGGPTVKLSDYMIKETKSKTSTMVHNHNIDDDDDDEDDDCMDSTAGQKRKRRRRSRKENSKTEEDGPISMAALTKKTRSRKMTTVDTSLPVTKPTTNGNSKRNKSSSSIKRRRSRKNQLHQHDPSVSAPVNSKHDPNSIASTRPKRRAALHKRRMLEEMLLMPSDDEDGADDPADQQVMITYGEEQMDFRVVDNQTIVHQPQVSTTQMVASNDSTLLVQDDDDDDDDEEIDIM